MTSWSILTRLTRLSSAGAHHAVGRQCRPVWRFLGDVGTLAEPVGSLVGHFAGMPHRLLVGWLVEKAVLARIWLVGRLDAGILARLVDIVCVADFQTGDCVAESTYRHG